MTNDEILEFVTNFFEKMTDKKQKVNIRNFWISILLIYILKVLEALNVLLDNINLTLSWKRNIFIIRETTQYWIVLPHELFHYIFNDYNVDQIYDTELFYSTEFEGMFANLLVNDYLKDSPDEYNFLNNYYLENYKDLTTGLLFG